MQDASVSRQLILESGVLTNILRYLLGQSQLTANSFYVSSSTK